MDTSEFTDEQIEALQTLADGYNDQSVSRRDVMKLVGAGGVGALLGGGGMASAVGQASAGTAQSGQLGAIGDPLDLVTEDVMDQSGNVVASANAGALEGTDLQYGSVNAEQINATDDIIAVGGGNALYERVDPSGTSTPLNDAIALLRAGGAGGTVYLPATTVQQNAPIDEIGKINIIGRGVESSIVEITDLTASGFLIDTADFQKRREGFIDGFTLSGMDRVNRTGGSAIEFLEPFEGFNIGHILITEWIDPVIDMSTAGPYASTWGSVIGSGYNGRLITQGGAGNSNHAQLLYCRNMDGATELDLNGFGRIENIVIGGGSQITGNPVLDFVGSDKDSVGSIYVERDINTTTFIDFGGSNGIFNLEQLQFGSGTVTVDQFYRIAGARRKQFPRPNITSGGKTVNHNWVDIEIAPPGPDCVYGGSLDDVQNTVNASECNLFCLREKKFADPAVWGTVTHTSGGPTRVDPNQFAEFNGNQFPEVSQPKIQTLEPASSGQVVADYPIPTVRPLWDDSAGHWDVVLGWDGHDPGSNVDYYIELVNTGIGQ